jgi:hypothetical protein
VAQGLSVGQVFEVRKLSTTRSSLKTPVYLDIRLAVRTATLDRIDAKAKNCSLSSIPLIEISKIQKLNDSPDGLIIYFSNSKVHRYWCAQRDNLINAILHSLHENIGVDVHVTTVESR